MLRILVSSLCLLAVVHANRVNIDIRKHSETASSQASVAAPDWQTCSTFLSMLTAHPGNTDAFCYEVLISGDAGEALAASNCSTADVEALCPPAPTTCGAALNRMVEYRVAVQSNPELNQASEPASFDVIKSMVCSNVDQAFQDHVDQVPRQCEDAAAVRHACGDCTSPTEDECSQPFRTPDQTCSTFLSMLTAHPGNTDAFCYELLISRDAGEAFATSNCSTADVEALCPPAPTTCGAALNGMVEYRVAVQSNPELNQAAEPAFFDVIKSMVCSNVDQAFQDHVDQVPRQCADAAAVRHACGDCTSQQLHQPFFMHTEEECSQPFRSSASNSEPATVAPDPPPAEVTDAPSTEASAEAPERDGIEPATVAPDPSPPEVTDASSGEASVAEGPEPDAGFVPSPKFAVLVAMILAF